MSTPKPKDEVVLTGVLFLINATVIAVWSIILSPLNEPIYPITILGLITTISILAIFDYIVKVHIFKGVLKCFGQYSVNLCILALWVFVFNWNREYYFFGVGINEFALVIALLGVLKDRNKFMAILSLILCIAPHVIIWSFIK